MYVTVGGSATVAEIFHRPGDYGEFETEDGTRLPPGWYWWLLTDRGVPDSYPVGPFDHPTDAMVDVQVASAAEPEE